MTDVPDWTGISAGPARAVTPQVFTVPALGSHSFNIPLGFTDRSIVLLGSTGGTLIPDGTSVSVSGNTTGTVYQHQSVWGGASSPYGLAAITVPAYGAQDASVQVTITNNSGSTPINYTIYPIVMPDEVVLGAQGNPMLTSAGGQPLGPPGSITGGSTSTAYDLTALFDPTLGTGQVIGNSSHPVNAQLRDSGGNSVGVAASPLYVTESGVGILSGVAATSINFTSTGNFTLISAPAAGRIRIVDHLVHTSTGTVFMNGALLPANVAISPKFPLLSGQTLVVQSSVASGSAWAMYHEIVD